MNQRTLLTIVSVLGGILFIALVFLGIFGYQLGNYKAAKTKEIQSRLDAQAEELKAAFQKEKETTTTTYTAAEVFGSFKFAYPKVWATNVSQEAKAATALSFLADPNLIVADKDAEGPFVALRVEVYSDSYDAKVKDIENRFVTNVKNPYKEYSTAVSGLKSRKFTGTNSESGKNIAFYLVPLRDKTLYIGTDDASKFSSNLEKILKTFSVGK